MKADGKVYPVHPDKRTPFGEVTFFRPDKALELKEITGLQQLENYLARHLPSPNFPYAIRITGKFSYIKARSIPRQTAPYPPLAEAAKRQVVFEFREVEGVMVGFFHPAYLAGVNLSGCHFHFLSADRRAGGHVLDCHVRQAKLELSRMDAIQVQLPGTKAFAETDLSGDKKQEIEKVEK